MSHLTCILQEHVQSFTHKPCKHICTTAALWRQNHHRPSATWCGKIKEVMFPITREFIVYLCWWWWAIANDMGYSDWVWQHMCSSAPDMQQRQSPLLWLSVRCLDRSPWGFARFIFLSSKTDLLWFLLISVISCLGVTWVTSQVFACSSCHDVINLSSISGKIFIFSVSFRQAPSGFR